MLGSQETLRHGSGWGGKGGAVARERAALRQLTLGPMQWGMGVRLSTAKMEPMLMKGEQGPHGKGTFLHLRK